MSTTIWIALTISTVGIWASLNTVDKFTLTNWVKDPVVPVLIQAIVGLLVGAFVILLNGVQSLSLLNYLWVFVSGASYALMAIFYFKALQHEEVSRSISVLYIAPVFVSILAFLLLNERFAQATYVGIFLLVSGALLISSRGLRVNRSFVLMLLAAILMSFWLVTTKYLLSFANVWTIFAYTRFASAITIAPFFVSHMRNFLGTATERRGTILGIISLNEALSLVGFFMITVAISIGYVTLVNALTSLQPLFVFVITLFLSVFYPRVLKEELTRSVIVLKSCAILMMLFGALLVV